jgi:hypothetical protein
VTSIACAQEPIDRLINPLQAQVRERMAVAVLDLCQSVTDGAEMAASPWLVALGSPEVTAADYDPGTLESVTEDGIRVVWSGSSCSVSYVGPDRGYFPEPGEGEGDAVSVLQDRVSAPEARWTLAGGDLPDYAHYVAADFRHWLRIDVSSNAASIGRYLNPPERVRAYFEAIEQANNRSAPEAILGAPDACAAFFASEPDLPEDSDASRMARELPTYDLQIAWAGRGGGGVYLRGAVDSSLEDEGSGCRLQINADRSGPGGDLDVIRSSVLALLAAPRSGWSERGENSWVRADGARLSLGERSGETQFWMIEPAPAEVVDGRPGPPATGPAVSPIQLRR